MDSQTRQEYVRAAVSFLQNPKLVDSPLKDKLKFLKDKGLSDVEVDEALNLALISRHQTQSGKWNFLLILGLCIGGYKLYQAYLEQKAIKKEGEQKSHSYNQNRDDHKITGSSKHPLSYEENTEAEKNQPTLNEILQRMSELKKLIELQRSNFGAEMQSLKTLLLGHEKFAAPPKIPEWQMPSQPEEPNKGSNAESSSSKSGKTENKSKVDSRRVKNSETSKPSSSNNGIIEPTAIIAPNPV
jgi:hypothetical protein